MAYDMPTFDPVVPTQTKTNGNRHDLPAIDMGTVRTAAARLRRGPSPQAVAAAMVPGTRFHSARDQVDILTHRNACLERKVAELAHQEMQARYLALHDSLTGLPNRRLLEDRFGQAIAGATRHRKPLALLLLDVDGFKWVNDKLGHAIGDTLLVSMVQRLTAGIRVGDTACRYGGDEFVLLLPEIDRPETAADVAAKIRVRLAIPYFTSGYRIHISVSVGAAVYPADGRNYEELLHNADRAMYRSKSAVRETSILMPHHRDGLFEADIQDAISALDATRLADSSFFQDTTRPAEGQP